MDFLNPYYLQIVVFALINVVNALSVFFAMSTGQISLGTAGFMAVGAYTSAILTMQYDIPMFVTVLLSGLIAVIASTLAHVTGGDIGHVISVASFLFYELVDTVYYDLTLFKDRNAPSFRPNWKKDIYWYTDPNRTIPTVPPYTIEIIQTWWG